MYYLMPQVSWGKNHEETFLIDERDS